jgi:CD2 antigen cytoplasmic tail-binding protein 2
VVDEEDGTKFEPFNLTAEREEGHFDEEGNYVERKEEDEQDAWLASDAGRGRCVPAACPPAGRWC